MLALRTRKFQAAKFLQDVYGQAFAEMEMDAGEQGGDAQQGDVQEATLVPFEIQGMGERCICVSFGDAVTLYS